MRSPRWWAKDAVYAACRLAGPDPQAVRAILVYHEVDGAGGPTLHRFERQVEELAERYRLVRLNELRAAVAAGGPVAAITFDDGYADTVDRVLPVLEEQGARATFFLPSGLLGGRFEGSYGTRTIVDSVAAKELIAAGHEVGGHTLDHPKLTQVPLEEARRQVVEDRSALQELLGVDVTSFAYPKGDHDDAVVEVVREAGYRAAVTVRESLLRGTVDPLRLPRISVNASMGMAQLRGKLSGGLERYERLRGRR